MEKEYNNEIWVDVIGFNGFYKVSNFGNIKKHLGSNQFGIFHIDKNIQPYENEKGYLKVGLTINKKRKIEKVHRLVAKHFIPNPKEYPEVNHKDGNKLNNHYSNLEWCNRKQNMKHASDNNLLSNRYGEFNNSAKAVLQYDLQGNLIKKWAYMKEAENALSVKSSKICNVCKGKRKTAGGFVWKYAEPGKLYFVIKHGKIIE